MAKDQKNQTQEKFSRIGKNFPRIEKKFLTSGNFPQNQKIFPKIRKNSPAPLNWILRVGVCFFSSKDTRKIESFKFAIWVGGGL
ncbi:hypothetical protein [Giesbergeria sp.]|uniref:hypothetical protein n=1 Tax=Giesbergeria sp. TaxID=2818473 RepID=UPI0026071BDD|nr:hypothetical protein [Giesbergeria sp.]